MNRRAFVRVAGLAGLGLVAGCTRSRSPQTDATPASPAPQPSPGDPSVPPPARPTDSPPAEESAPSRPGTEPPISTVRAEVICRDALGLSAAAGTGARHRLRRVTLHHTAVELGANRQVPARLRGHQRYHMDQGWPDIAYHYGVDLRGNVYELRDPDQAGDTFTSYDPTGHLLVVCEGNYDLEQPSDAMLEGVVELLVASADTHGVDPMTLKGHRDYAPETSCPGDALQQHLPDLRDAAVARGDETTGELVTVCGEAASRRVARIEAGAHEENEA